MRRRHLCVLAGALAVSLLPAAAASAQEAPETPVPNFQECAQNIAFPGPSGEIYGPTDVNAQSANQAMAVAVNRDATVTVLRWPRPSFYDQIKYRTSSRDAERFGALVNEGSFLGLAVDTGDGPSTTWLRDLPSEQLHEDEWNDVITTTYRAEELGLTVVVRDVVVADLDVFAREVVVTRDPGSPVTSAELVAFENLQPVVSKIAYIPAYDWCGDELNEDIARYDPAADAIVHFQEGVDVSTGQPSSAAVGMALRGPSSQHQVGGDAHEGTATPDAKLPGPTQDAFDDAADGTLQGNSEFAGQTTGALTAALDLTRDGTAAATVYLAGAPDHAGVVDAIEEARGRTFEELVAGKRAWLDAMLDEAPLPDTDDPDVLAVSQRALVTLVSTYDPISGAIVASIATQSPYGEDWIRDGAFFNHVLDLIGHEDWVAKRLRWYASLQSKEVGTGQDNPFAELYGSALVPPGNWAMNYYADGVVGGPIPWEIDETGYGLWAFWDHYGATGDEETLRAVYPSIQLGADFLTEWRDPRNGLHAHAIEDDNPQPRQTIDGAGPVFLGLESAVAAAETLGETADAEAWGARRDELRAGIEAELYADGSYGDGNGVIVWPVCFHPYGHERFADGQYDAIWERLAPTFDAPDSPRMRGLYESKGLIALAKATKDRPLWLERVRTGLRWIATEHAQPGTRVMGEEWLNEDGEIVSTVSQPHIWEQILFYLAALEAYPPGDLTVEDTVGCDGAVGALRAASAQPTRPRPPVPAPDADRPGGGALPATGGGAVALALLTIGAAVLTRRR
ncbi:MAG: hypothetical protein KY457_05695 [Actinobacteria bacterium]|nr:hypothetical protein [Actinomycetota bacterium]